MNLKYSEFKHTPLESLDEFISYLEELVPLLSDELKGKVNSDLEQLRYRRDIENLGEGETE